MTIISNGGSKGDSGGLLKPPPRLPLFYMSYENEIIWSLRQNYFIFMGYSRKWDQISKATPPLIHMNSFSRNSGSAPEFLIIISQEINTWSVGQYAWYCGSNVLNFLLHVTGLRVGRYIVVIWSTSFKMVRRAVMGAREGRYGCTCEPIRVSVSRPLWVWKHKEYQPG